VRAFIGRQNASKSAIFLGFRAEAVRLTLQENPGDIRHQ
jgi:hypothetical protein